MKKTKEELLKSVVAILGDNNSDEALALLEDIKDSVGDVQQTDDQTDWKKKYEENDSQWRERYKNTFVNGSVDMSAFQNNNGAQHDSEDGEPTTEIKDLFAQNQ